VRRTAGQLLLLLAGLVAAAGCGSDDGKPTSDGDNSALRFSGDQRAIGQVVEDYATARRGNDWDRICDDLYTASNRDLTQGLIADSCADALADRSDSLDRLSVTVTEIEDQTTARVSAETYGGAENEFGLVKDGGRWRIDSTSGDFRRGGPAQGSPPPGLSPEERAPAEAVLAYDQALEDKDWSRICEELFTDTQAGGSDIEAPLRCVNDLRRDYGRGALGLIVTNVEVTTAATARTRVGENEAATFTLLKEGGRWRIDSLAGTFPND
jgi:hypothetical protein